MLLAASDLASDLGKVSQPRNAVLQLSQVHTRDELESRGPCPRPTQPWREAVHAWRPFPSAGHHAGDASGPQSVLTFSLLWSRCSSTVWGVRMGGVAPHPTHFHASTRCGALSCSDRVPDVRSAGAHGRVGRAGAGTVSWDALQLFPPLAVNTVACVDEPEGLAAC